MKEAMTEQEKAEKLSNLSVREKREIEELFDVIDEDNRLRNLNVAAAADCLLVQWLHGAEGADQISAFTEYEGHGRDASDAGDRYIW